MAAYKQNKMRIILLARLCSDFPHSPKEAQSPDTTALL